MCVYVCARERERERGGGGEVVHVREKERERVCLCQRVCVHARTLQFYHTVSKTCSFMPYLLSVLINLIDLLLQADVLVRWNVTDEPMLQIVRS